MTEVSLNFAAFARLIRQPSGFVERALGRALALGDAWFQIERLYRFNAKFFPDWEPRYFMYERRLGLPRAGIAALWLEGQLPKPRIFRRAPARHLSRPTGACGTPPAHGSDRMLVVPRQQDEEDRKRDLDQRGLEHSFDLILVAAREHDVEPGVAQEQRRRNRGSRRRHMRIGARCPGRRRSATASAMSNPTQATSQWVARVLRGKPVAGRASTE